MNCGGDCGAATPAESPMIRRAALASAAPAGRLDSVTRRRPGQVLLPWRRWGRFPHARASPPWLPALRAQGLRYRSFRHGGGWTSSRAASGPPCAMVGKNGLQRSVGVRRVVGYGVEPTPAGPSTAAGKARLRPSLEPAATSDVGRRPNRSGAGTAWNAELCRSPPPQRSLAPTPNGAQFDHPVAIGSGSGDGPRASPAAVRFHWRICRHDSQRAWRPPAA